jgi:hypothetical protein
MLTNLAAITTAFALSLKHQRRLCISPSELKRYYAKSINLALCYRGFSADRSVRVGQKIGRAAFFCCAYDVITDWRAFDPSLCEWFENLLFGEMGFEAAEIARNLYNQEKFGMLQHDGLSRGVAAINFVTRIIGSDAYLHKITDLNQLGLVMQIVDDVIDLEDDRRDQAMNCILSPRWRGHLFSLLEFDTAKLKRFLPHATVLSTVIRHAQGKASQLLSGRGSLTLKHFADIERRPAQNVKDKQQREVLCDINKKSKVIDHYSPEDAPAEAYRQ